MASQKDTNADGADTFKQRMTNLVKDVGGEYNG